MCAAESSVYLQKRQEKGPIKRQNIIAFINIGLSYRVIARKVKVSVSTLSFTIKMNSETGTGRGQTNPKPQMNQEDTFLSVNSFHDRWLS